MADRQTASRPCASQGASMSVNGGFSFVAKPCNVPRRVWRLDGSAADDKAAVPPGCQSRIPMRCLGAVWGRLVRSLSATNGNAVSLSPAPGTWCGHRERSGRSRSEAEGMVRGGIGGRTKSRGTAVDAVRLAPSGRPEGSAPPGDGGCA